MSFFFLFYNQGSVQGVSGTGGAGAATTETDDSTSLVGVAATGQVGSPSFELDENPSLTGVFGSGQIGSLLTETDGSPAIAGVVGSGQIGSLLTETDESPAGVAGSGQIGSPVVEIDNAIAGASCTGQLGSLLTETDDACSVTGTSGTGQVGSTSVEIDASSIGDATIGLAGSLASTAGTILLGAAGTGQGGSSVTETDADIVGRAGTAQVGSLGSEVDESPAIAGVTGIGQIGSPDPGVGASSLSGGAAGQAGSSTTEIGTIVAGAVSIGDAAEFSALNTSVTGVALTGQVSSPAVEVDVSMIGVEATAAAGDAVVYDLIIVSLYSDEAGAPGEFIAIIGSFLGSDVDSTPTTIALTPATPIPLEVNTRYWVQVTNTNTTTVKWVTLDNDGGTGVAPEFWYKSTGDSGDNVSGPAYQMAVFADVTIGLSGVAGGGQAGDVVINGAFVAGVAGTGSAGTVDIAVGVVDQITVSLYSDNAGVPGDFIEVIGTFFDAAISTEPTTITLEPSNPIALAANTRYWVQVTNSLTTTVRWVTLDNDGGTGVAPEFWYKNTGDSGSNVSGPAYQMAVFNEALAGVSGTGQVGSPTTQSSSATLATSASGTGEAGSLVASVAATLNGVAGLGQSGVAVGETLIDNVTITGVAGTGEAGIAKHGRVYKKRSGRGADNKHFKPELFSKPVETDAQAMARWRKMVDELLDLPPRQGEDTQQPEPDQPQKPQEDFSFLNSLPEAKPDVPVVTQPNWQAIAEADDALLFGEGVSGAQSDDLLLLGDWL